MLQTRLSPRWPAALISAKICCSLSLNKQEGSGCFHCLVTYYSRAVNSTKRSDTIVWQRAYKRSRHIETRVQIMFLLQRPQKKKSVIVQCCPLHKGQQEAQVCFQSSNRSSPGSVMCTVFNSRCKGWENGQERAVVGTSYCPYAFSAAVLVPLASVHICNKH